MRESDRTRVCVCLCVLTGSRGHAGVARMAARSLVSSFKSLIFTRRNTRHT